MSRIMNWILENQETDDDFEANLAPEATLPENYQRHLDNQDTMKDKKDKWWEPLDDAMASKIPPF